MLTRLVTPFEQISGNPARLHIQYCIDRFVSRIPFIYKDIVQSCFNERSPVEIEKCIIILPQNKCCIRQKLKIRIKVFVPSSGSVHIQFGSVTVKKCNCHFTANNILSHITHPENREIGLYQLIEIKLRTQVDGIVDTS